MPDCMLIELASPHAGDPAEHMPDCMLLELASPHAADPVERDDVVKTSRADESQALIDTDETMPSNVDQGQEGHGLIRRRR